MPVTMTSYGGSEQQFERFRTPFVMAVDQTAAHASHEACGAVCARRRDREPTRALPHPGKSKTRTLPHGGQCRKTEDRMGE